MRSAKPLHKSPQHEGEHDRAEERDFVTGEFHRRERPSCEVPIGCSCGEELEKWRCENNTDPKTTAA